MVFALLPSTVSEFVNQVNRTMLNIRSFTTKEMQMDDHSQMVVGYIWEEKVEISATISFWPNSSILIHIQIIANILIKLEHWWMFHLRFEMAKYLIYKLGFIVHKLRDWDRLAVRSPLPSTSAWIASKRKSFTSKNATEHSIVLRLESRFSLNVSIIRLPAWRWVPLPFYSCSSPF